MINQEMDRLVRLKDQKGDIQCDELKAWIQEAMWKGVLVVRREEGLTQTMRALSDYRKNVQRVNIQTGSELISLLEVENLLEIGRAICIAALHRCESRGSHYREDHPHIDPRWEKRILLRYMDEKIQVHEEPA